MSKVISGFPGIGKSYYTKNNSSLLVSDSDSSKFDKSNFPNNYIDHIKELISKDYDLIFASSHKDVRESLVREGIEYTLVYPKRELKEEYLTRYKCRGNCDSFVKLLSDNWDNWITELEQQKGCTHLVLDSNTYLKDVL